MRPGGDDVDALGRFALVMIGAVDGTTLTYSKTVSGAPLTTGFGKLTQFWDTGPFVVQSQDAQHPNTNLVLVRKDNGKCNNGLHTISSPQPFGLVWAWDQYVSYAYPAGASVQPINTVIVPATPH